VSVTPASFAFDHAVVLVRDLERAVNDYTTLGFQVAPGGVHSGGLTRNALVPFSDGTYLELLAVARPLARLTLRVAPMWTPAARRSPLLRRARRRTASGEGLLDFALACASADEVVRAVGPADGPVSGGRVRPDGFQLSWKVAFPQAAVLPFVIEDITPRRERVPPAPPHPNGALGVHTVTVATSEFGEAMTRFTALLGREPFETTAPMPETRAVEFRLGATVIRLLAPAGRSPVLRRHLARFGSGPYSIAVRSSRPRAGALDARLAHGAQLHLVPG
jgi:hypothetical protein